jgi:NAD(P)-dependent dehydrogenase (short-subunit alcohol dehydrogenase family)
MPTWLITGCSTGLGRHLAEAVLARGYNAIVTARDATKVQDLVDANPDTALALALDVTEDTQVTNAVQQAEERFGGVDVLVNNAGYGYRAAVEEGEEPEVATLFATNFFGPVAMIKAVLPGMRARRNGAIVNISSIGARISPPGSGYYSATKAALEALSASLRRELEPLGITVTVVEPGGFRTDFRRPFTAAVTGRHRRLRRHGRAPAQGARHRAREPAGRSGTGCPGDHHSRRSPGLAVPTSARQGRACRFSGRGRRAGQGA